MGGQIAFASNKEQMGLQKLCCPSRVHSCTGQWWSHRCRKKRRTTRHVLAWPVRFSSCCGLCKDAPDPFSPSSQDHTALFYSKRSCSSAKNWSLEKLGKNETTEHGDSLPSMLPAPHCYWAQTVRAFQRDQEELSTPQTVLFLSSLLLCLWVMAANGAPGCRRSLSLCSLSAPSHGSCRTAWILQMTVDLGHPIISHGS